MDIRFYNTLTHRIESFAPISPPDVYMYNCGPTVYDYAHIGNFRAFVFADVLRRFLELTGHTVHQVMNLTDVGHMTDDQLADGGGEDKMQLAARRLKEAKKSGADAATKVANPDDPYQVAQFYIDAFIDDAKKLGLKIADEYPKQTPRATDHVGKMMKIILKLVENGHAYVAKDGAVYYDVQSFPDYGKLSGNTLDKLRSGSGGRVQDEHQAVKKHPADFLLWKPDPRHIMKWDPRKWEAPWGEGYPGWHIECSAMATELLGREVIDIHTGGEDNIFPHHECEIAQSRGASGQAEFARFWMHTRFLLVDGEKMSKSKGNFYTVRDVLEGKVTGRPVDPAVLRFELLKSHYRSNMNFTARGLGDSASRVRRMQDFYRLLLADLHKHYGKNLAEMNREADNVKFTHPSVSPFVEAVGQDLNISGGLAVVSQWLKSNPQSTAETLGIFERFNDVIGLPATRRLEMTTSNDNVPWGTPRSQSQTVITSMDPGIQDKCNQIDDARDKMDFATADRLRKELQDAGYEVSTTKAGTTARKKLA